MKTTLLALALATVVPTITIAKDKQEAADPSTDSWEYLLRRTVSAANTTFVFVYPDAQENNQIASMAWVLINGLIAANAMEREDNDAPYTREEVARIAINSGIIRHLYCMSFSEGTWTTDRGSNTQSMTMRFVVPQEALILGLALCDTVGITGTTQSKATSWKQNLWRWSATGVGIASILLPALRYKHRNTPVGAA